MAIRPPYPSFASVDLVDSFFIKGRNMWPDLAELRELKVDRYKIPDNVVRFIRSTCLNEHGVAHYHSGYLAFYGNDYKLRLSNIIGREVRTVPVRPEAAEGGMTLNLADLPSGMYFYSLLQNDKVLSTKRLVLQN